MVGMVGTGICFFVGIEMLVEGKNPGGWGLCIVGGILIR